MIAETASDIAKESRKRINESKGTRARRLAVHELPIPGAAASLRKALAMAAHVQPASAFPRHSEKCEDVEPDPDVQPRDGNPYRASVTLPMIRPALRVVPSHLHRNASRAIRWVLNQVVRGFHGIRF